MSNTVSGNFIGTNVSGTAAISNTGNGVSISGGEGAQYNVIGGDTPGKRNLISGNGDQGTDGVIIFGAGTTNNTVSANYIGTDVSGATAIANGGSGIYIGYGASHNLVGGDTPGERNLISGNTFDGVAIFDSGTTDNTVSGNYIGTNASGKIGRASCRERV